MTLGFILLMKIFVLSINGASVKKYKKPNIYYSESIIHALVCEPVLPNYCSWIADGSQVCEGCPRCGLGTGIVLTPVISG